MDCNGADPPRTSGATGAFPLPTPSTLPPREREDYFDRTTDFTSLSLPTGAGLGRPARPDALQLVVDDGGEILEGARADERAPVDEEGGSPRDPRLGPVGEASLPVRPVSARVETSGELLAAEPELGRVLLETR
jgi:hypothetical protein